jgi:hypothetical protein
MPTNDNDTAAQHASDPHGQAALLLVESLIHGLCENNMLTTAAAIEIVERAVSVQSDLARAADGAGVPMWASHALLSSIAASLRTDDEGGSTTPRLVT